jgi:protein-tyrosine phosphatase
MTNPEMIARRLRLPGTQNVRDIGGYPTSDGGWTRWGLLLRGDSLQEVDDEGLTRLADYGLRTVIDLRTAAERKAYADRLPRGVRLVAAPLLDSLSDGRPAGQSVQEEQAVTRLPDLADRYRYFVDQRGERIARALAELARPGALPALVHCMAGKDRTGIVVALTLSALGVPDDVVAADYAATDLFLGADFRAAATARAAARGIDAAQYARLLISEPGLILGLLEYVRGQHGSARAFLASHGLASSELADLRGRLIAPDQGE